MLVTRSKIWVLSALTLLCLFHPKATGHDMLLVCPEIFKSWNKSDSINKLVSRVTANYGLEQKYAEDVVKFVKKNSYKDFPTVRDILAVIGIESSFDTQASNQGAYGLMQIQYFWFTKYVQTTEELYDPYVNITLGIDTLRQYFLKLRNKEDAIIAYQAGIKNFLEGDYTHEYLNRYRQELTRYD